MAKLHGAIFGRSDLIAVFSMMLLTAVAGLGVAARAQGPTLPPLRVETPIERDLGLIRGTFSGANATLNDYARAACLFPADRAALTESINKAIARLDELSIAEGKIFIDTGETAASEAYNEGTRDSVALDRELKFLLGLPNCAGAPPPAAGGGGAATTPVTPYGPIPHSQTQIPPCLNADAKQLLEIVEKNIPEDEQTIKDQQQKMDELHTAVIDLQQQKARAAAANKDTGTIDVEITKDMADYSTAASRLRTAEVRLSQNKEDLEKLKKLKPCPDEHGYYVPPRPGGGEQYVSYATDSTTYCTYTEATVATAVVSYDPGTPGNAGTTPAPQPGGPTDTPRASTPPPATPDKPQTPAAPPPEPAKTVEVTPSTPDDTPSDIPDDVQLKVTQEVLEGGSTGGPLEGQTIKLTQTDKPELPATGGDKPVTRTDTGFDKPPAQCTTDANGTCSIAVRPSERTAYHLPALAKGEHRTYHLDLARPQTSGGVAEVTVRKDKIDPRALASIGSKVASTTFKIGNRSFVRFSLATRYGIDPTLPAKLKEAYGPSYEEDLCQEKYPDGPADEVASAPASHDGELPGRRITLRRTAANGGLR